MNILIGTGVALVTPFKSDLSIDHQALAKIVEYNISNGVNYLVISGTTGESVTVTAAEKKEITQTVIDANKGRVPLVIGIGGNNTAAVVAELQSTDLSPFAAILSVAPYYSKPTQEGFYQHFKDVAEASSIPVILYNVPGRTAKNVEASTVLRLANDFKSIVAVKEAGNNMEQYLELIKHKPKDFLVISGDDAIALPMTLAGGAGVISVIGQAIAQDFSDMIRYALNGDVAEAYELHYKISPCIDMIFEQGNPTGIKALLHQMNICEAGVRLPLVQADEDLSNRMKSYLEDYDQE